MAIKCFSRTIPGYKTVSGNIRSNYPINIPDEIISDAIYRYAAEKGLDDAVDSFNPENITELQEYLDNYFLVDREVDFSDKETNDIYSDWYLENTTDGGIVDITEYSNQQLEDLNDITANSAIIIEDNNRKYAIVPRPKNLLASIEREMQSIKDAAIKNGTFMKAPNGKDTNLTERQWLQVRTKNFKNWFGDWENDQSNASKIVDENGEPLVVYHGNKYPAPIREFKKGFKNTFNTTKEGYYFTDDTKVANYFSDTSEYTEDGLRSLNENLKELLDYKFEGDNYIVFGNDNTGPIYLKVNTKDKNEIISIIKNSDTYKSEEQDIERYKLFIGSKGQVLHVFLDIKDSNKIKPYILGGRQFIVDSSNQIKSATGNSGTFSAEDNNIYHNTTLEGIYNRVLRFVEDKKNSGQRFSLKEINAYFGTNIGFNPETKEFTTKSPKIDGVSIYNPNDTKIEAKRNLDRAKLLKYLGDKFNLKIKEVSQEEYAKRVGDFSNCCVIGDTVYIKHSQNYTNEQIIEEFLHPAVHALYGTNRELVDNLLNEARKLFPDLDKQIKVAYKSHGESVQEEELITQVLSKYLNKEISDNGIDTRTIVDYIKQLFYKIAELFQDLFGNANVQEGTREQISGADIREAYSFENLAQLINSKEIEFTDILPENEIRKNKTGNNKVNKKYQENPKVYKIKLTFEQQVDKIKNQLKALGKSVEFNEKDHSYKINGKKADVSVTSIKDFLEGNKKESSKSVATIIGTSYDHIVRDFFAKNGKLTGYYPNISVGQKKAIKRDLESLKSYFDETFKEGYEVITDENLLRVGGYINKGKKKIGVAGTMDMLVIAKNGDNVDIYIYDVKTRRGEMNNSTLVKYTDQVNFYKQILSSNSEYIADNIAGIGLIVAQTFYGKNDELTMQDYDEVGENSDIITYENRPIEGTKNEISIRLRSELYKNEGKILKLDTSKYIEKEKFDFTGLSVEEKEAMAGLGETDADLFAKAGKEIRKNGEEEIDFSVDETYKRMSENIPIEDNSSSMTEREKVFIGKSIVKYISFLADQLATDVNTKIAIFGDRNLLGPNGEPQSSYENDYFIGKRNTLMTQDVFNRLKKYLVEETDFLNPNRASDDAVAEKMIYAAEHIDAFINAAYAELLDIERISISASGDSSLDNVDADTLEAYERAEQAVEERAAYSIDSREISYLGSISSEFKRGLSKIFNYKYDEEGNVVVIDGEVQYEEDEWGYGIPQFIPRAVVINKLYEICYGLGDSRQMMNAIQEEATTYPWLSQVYELINNNTDLKRQLFTVFRRNKNNFEKVISVDTENGDAMSAIPLNSREKVDRIINGITARLNGEYVPNIFNNDRADANGVFTIDSDVLEDLIDRAKKLNGLSGKKKTREIVSILDDLGIDGIDNVRNLTGRESRKLISNIINALYLDKFSVIKTLSRLEKSGKKVSFEKDLSVSYRNLIEAIAPVLDESSELSTHDNQKNYSVYSDPTAMNTIIDRLAGRATIPYLGKDEVPSREELYNMLFAGKYDKYWQYSYVIKDEDGLPKRIYYCDWLQSLKDNNDGERELFQHSTNTSVSDTEYLKQNNFLYAMGAIFEYAAPSMAVTGKTRFYTGKKNVAKYRIPTQSDKPANEYIQFLKVPARLSDEEENYGLDEMKQTIADKAFNYLRFEISRMKMLIDHLKTDDGSGDIEHFTLPLTQKNIELRNGAKVTFDHLVEDGKMLADGTKVGGNTVFTGMKFEYLPMLNDELIGKTEYGQKIIDAINGGEEELEALKDGFFKIYSNAMDKEFGRVSSFIKSHGGYTLLQNSIDVLYDDDTTDAFLQEFVWNDTLAAMNIFNLTVVDPAFHKNSSDLQKRFAEFHASTLRPNLLATFMENGVEKRVSDGRLRYVVLEDSYKDSSLVDDVVNIFLDAAKEAKAQGNNVRAAQLRVLASKAKKDFKDIILTDGQAFGSPTGFWKKMQMLGDNNEEFNRALERIKKGDFNLKDYEICIQAFKPFVFSQREQNIGGSDSLVPTQIKDSEAMIYLAGAIMKGAGKTGLIPALYNIMEDSHYADKEHSIYRNNGIDMFVFHSAVKTGASKILSIDGVKPENIEKVIRDTIYSNGEYTDYVQDVSFEDWGKQQEVPAHNQDNEQGMTSQGRILSVGDLSDTNDYKIAGEKEPVSKKKFLDRYFDLHKRVFEKSIELAGKKLGLNGNRLERNKKLSEILINNIAKDNKYSVELRKAFTLVNGEFVIPLGDPSLGDKVYGAVLSLIKKTINDELYPGGPTVIRSSVGFDEDLHFFKDKDGGYTAEVYASFPSKVIENAMTYDSNNKKHKKIKGYNDGDIISVADGLKYGLITEDDIIGIADRIPTENKYSQIRYRIKEFLPEQAGEYFIFPKEKTMLGGDDFDIDKVYPRRKYRIDYSRLQEMVESGEADAEELHKQIEILELKNEIFDMQWQALGHKSSLTKLFKPGSFKTLKDIAKEINPDFGHENHPLTYFSSQMFYQKANAAGKQFVGIAALNNTAHTFCEIAHTGFTSIPDFTINGVSSQAMLDKNTGEYIFDPMYSAFDGSLISDTVCMFVGASADNAKDAVLGALNTNPVTANVFMGMLRMGIPLRTAIYMMNLPSVKAISEQAEYSGDRFEDVLSLLEISENGGSNPLYESKNITDETLFDRIKANDGNMEDIDIAVLELLKDLVPYCNAIRAVTDRTAVNSTKNAAHKNAYDAMQRKLKAEEFKNRNFDEAELLGETALNINREIPFLGTLSSINTDFIPRVFESFSPIFSREFKNDDGTGVLDRFMAAGYKAGQMNEKTLKSILNAWLVYKASKFGIIDMGAKARRDRIYKFPISEFRQISGSAGNNMFIQNILTGKMNGKYPIISLSFKSSRFTRETIDDIAASYADLSGNDEMRPFLNDYLDYMLTRFGFMFSPFSSMTITPNIEKLRYKKSNGVSPYVDIFSKDASDASFGDFVIQFARNNIYSPLWFSTSKENISSQSKDGNTITIPDYLEDAVNNRGSVGIRIGKSLYIATGKHDDDGNAIYQKTSRLGVPNQFMEYNANEDGEKMETVITRSNNMQQQKAYVSMFTQDDEDSDPDSEEQVEPQEIGANDRDDATESYSVDWFEKMRTSSNFKSLISDAGFDIEFFNRPDENALLNALTRLYKSAEKAGIKNKHSEIMKEIKDKIC